MVFYATIIIDNSLIRKIKPRKQWSIGATQESACHHRRMVRKRRSAILSDEKCLYKLKSLRVEEFGAAVFSTVNDVELTRPTNGFIAAL